MTSPPAISPSPPEHALDSNQLPVSSTAAISGSPASEFARFGRIAASGGGHARSSPLNDSLPFEFGQDGNDAEDQLTARRSGVDAGAEPGQQLEANATCCEVMHRVDQVPQTAAKPVQLSNETDRGLKERLLNLLAQGQALTRTRLRDLLVVKNERPGEVLESLERAGQPGRTPRRSSRGCPSIEAQAMPLRALSRPGKRRFELLQRPKCRLGRGFVMAFHRRLSESSREYAATCEIRVGPVPGAEARQLEKLDARNPSQPGRNS